MTGLAAILERELRQIVRRRAIYTLRSGAVVATLLLSMAILFSHLASGNPSSMGRDVFNAIVHLSFGLSLLVGPMFAADAVSAEKRDGTLGLLMLTPLRAYEVVGGKLVALLLPGLQVLLAILPVFSLAFFMGGVSTSELGRALLVLCLTLMLSLSLSLSTSCFLRAATPGLMLSSSLLLILVIAVPLAQYSSSTGTIDPGALSWLSPTYALRLISTSRYAATPAEFWITSAVICLLSTGVLAVAGIAITRTWRDRSPGLTQRFKRRQRSSELQNIQPRRRVHPQILEHHPLLWLATRFQTGLRWTWGLLVVAAGVWIGCVFVWSSQMLDYVAVFLSFHLVNLSLKLWVAWHASHRLAEDRHSGSLEMLLCLPIHEDEVWKSWLLHLKSRLFWPFMTVIITEALILSISLLTLAPGIYDALIAWVIFAVMTLFLVADSYTLSWAGMSYSLSSKSSGMALAKAIMVTLVLPSAVVLPLTGTLGGGATTTLGPIFSLAMVWGAVSLNIDSAVCAHAIARLTDSFRAQVGSSWQKPADFKVAWKSLSPSGRRKSNIAPTPQSQ